MDYDALVGSLTDGVLADTILIPPAHQLKEGKDSAKKVWKQVNEKLFTRKKKKEM